MFRECEICGKKFWVYPYQIKRGSRFCSVKCYGQWISKNKIGENNPGWRGGKVERKCETCGQVFWVYPSQTKEEEVDFVQKNVGKNGLAQV